LITDSSKGMLRYSRRHNKSSMTHNIGCVLLRLVIIIRVFLLVRAICRGRLRHGKDSKSMCSTIKLLIKMEAGLLRLSIIIRFFLFLWAICKGGRRHERDSKGRRSTIKLLKE